MQPPRSYRNTILAAVLDAQKYLKDSSTGSLDGFLAMTDSIIYAIKVANPKGLSKDDSESQKLEAVRFSVIITAWHACIYLCMRT